MHDLMWLWWLQIGLCAGLVFIGLLQHLTQRMKNGKVAAVLCRSDRSLDQMISRYIGRIDLVHQCVSFPISGALMSQALAPFGDPMRDCFCIIE